MEITCLINHPKVTDKQLISGRLITEIEKELAEFIKEKAIIIMNKAISKAVTKEVKDNPLIKDLLNQKLILNFNEKRVLYVAP